MDVGNERIDRDAGITPWRQLAAILDRKIRTGKLTGRLPSERDLAAEYEVSVTLVRKALAELRDRGLIVTEQGWGSSVARHGDSRPCGEPP